jgi:NAD(P)-dependent dehydrogenase (short-subunit alcohol dehydrogenase family)
MNTVANIDGPVIITGSRGLLGSALARYITDNGGCFIGFDIEDGYDITDAWQVRSFMEIHSTCRHMVHFAALDSKIVGDSEAESSSIDASSFAKMLYCNVYGTWIVNSLFAETRSEGVVVNVSSVYSIKNPLKELYREQYGKNPAYTSSKAAQNMLNTQLSSIYAPNFRFNSLVIGAVAQDQSLSFQQRYSQATLLQRMMRLEEVIDPCLFLLGNGASYITGTALIVDGGYRL